MNEIVDDLPSRNDSMIFTIEPDTLTKFEGSVLLRQHRSNMTLQRRYIGENTLTADLFKRICQMAQNNSFSLKTKFERQDHGNKIIFLQNKIKKLVKAPDLEQAPIGIGSCVVIHFGHPA